MWRRDLLLLVVRRACRRDNGNAKKCSNANAERKHDRSSPLARQPQYEGTESFAFASLMVIATLRRTVTGATRACARARGFRIFLFQTLVVSHSAAAPGRLRRFPLPGLAALANQT